MRPSNAGFYQVLEGQRGIPFQFLRQVVIEILLHVKVDIETGEVHQFERPHGIIETELCGFVYIFFGSDTLFPELNGFDEVGNHEPVDEEPGDVNFNFNGFFSEFPREVQCGCNGCIACLDAANDFHELHERDGVEEVHADNLVGSSS